jgi:hypothetical protein
MERPMPPEELFSLANRLAMVGWIALVAALWGPRWLMLAGGFAVPAVLSLLYAGLTLAFFAGAQGGFSSLDAVALLLSGREMLLAGWVHFLAFDLFVGAWQVRAARRDGVPGLLVVPCLALTFLFGPAGLLAFLALRAAITATRLAPTAAVRP